MIGMAFSGLYAYSLALAALPALLNTGGKQEKAEVSLAPWFILQPHP